MARAKNTDRAAARRRYREQTNAAVNAETPDEEVEQAVPDAAPSSVSSTMRGMFRMPDVRQDLRILPRMILGDWKLWIPFIALFVAFVLAVALDRGLVPQGIDGIVAIFVQLTLPPTALFVFFIGGFLAPRASYLVGAVLGLVDGLLWSLLFVISPNAQQDEPSRVVAASDYLTIVLVAVVVGTLAAGFAAWYRNFLRQSQERARQNKVARDQAARAKAKEDERKAREEQRLAQAAARQGTKPTPPSR